MSKHNGHQKLFSRTGSLRRRSRREGWMVLPLLLCGFAADGHAGPTGSETNAIRLQYDRRDLASPAAARRLLVRIGDAALEACGASPFSLTEFKNAVRYSQCWRDAVDDAVRRIGNPTLSALTDEDVP